MSDTGTLRRAADVLRRGPVPDSDLEHDVADLDVNLADWLDWVPSDHWAWADEHTDSEIVAWLEARR